jgi:hypothetical protein
MWWDGVAMGVVVQLMLNGCDWCSFGSGLQHMQNAAQSAAELATRNRQGNEEHAGHGKDCKEGKLREFKAHVQCCNGRWRVNVKKCTGAGETIEQNKNGDTEKCVATDEKDRLEQLPMFKAKN